MVVARLMIGDLVYIEECETLGMNEWLVDVWIVAGRRDFVNMKRMDISLQSPQGHGNPTQRKVSDSKTDGYFPFWTRHEIPVRNNDLCQMCSFHASQLKQPMPLS